MIGGRLWALPLAVSIDLKGAEALSSFLAWLAQEVLRGTIDRMSIATTPDGTTRVAIVFNTTAVNLPPILSPPED
jgi:hypothetical protein